MRRLKNKIYKHKIAVSKNVYIDKLNEIVGKYNNICHRTNRINPANLKSGTYIDYGAEHNGKDPKFKVGGHLRI